MQMVQLHHNLFIYDWDAVLWLRIKMKVQTEAYPVQGLFRPSLRTRSQTWQQ